MGPGINEWVSDYFQRPPGQQSGTGPYCYVGNVERVQFWRHKSVLNGAPEVKELPSNYVETNPAPASSGTNYEPVTVNEVSGMNDGNKKSNRKGIILGYNIRQK
jgi:hypothetical protein